MPIQTATLTPVEWGEAIKANLEGGERKQTKNWLRRNDDVDKGLSGFCCLGAACDIADPTKWEGYYYEGETTMPPNHVLQMFGLSGLAGELASWNDAGWTFRQIAFEFRKTMDLWDGYTPKQGDIRNDLFRTPVLNVDYFPPIKVTNEPA
jgi:hypothetical protein